MRHNIPAYLLLVHRTCINLPGYLPDSPTFLGYFILRTLAQLCYAVAVSAKGLVEQTPQISGSCPV